MKHDSPLDNRSIFFDFFYFFLFPIFYRSSILIHLLVVESERRGTSKEKQVAVLRNDSGGSQSVSIHLQNAIFSSPPFLLLNVSHLLFLYFCSVREQQDERRVIGEESIVVTISNPSKRPASACNSLESAPRKRKEAGAQIVQEPERIPSVIRWKEPSSHPSEQALFEPDLSRSPPTTSSLKTTSRSSPSVSGTAPVPLSPTSPSTSTSPPPPIELVPLVKRHPNQDEIKMSARSISVDSFRSFIHVKCESASGESVGDAIKSREKKKYWSFDDLTSIQQRKDANEDEFKSDHQQAGRLAHILIPGSAGSGSRCRSPSVIIMSSPRHSSCESAIDPEKLRRMKKEAIITLWKSSERQLLNSLQDVLHEKRALEQKLLVLQQMLLKPP